MNSQQTNNSNLTINSKHFSDRIDTDIIQLTKTIMLEYGLELEEAKSMARKKIQKKLNSIMTSIESQGITDLIYNTKEIIKTGRGVLEKTYAKSVYELLKTMELL
jgi:hypothetical protein